jgi:aspartate aminotransferase-like enzyme
MQKQLLFIPGPVTVAEPVLAAMSRPMIDHRGSAFAALLERISSGMQEIFGTTAEVVLLGSSGTGGLEAAVSSSFSPRDIVLACPVGVFGKRFISIARNFGLEVEVLDTPFGHRVDAQALAARLKADTGKRIAGILLTHNETSTGVENDMTELAEAIGDHPATVIVDSVSGLGASEFRMDEWGFDIVVTASQKALAAPPGLAMVAVSDRAWRRMEAARASRFSLDLAKAREFAKNGQTPWTPPVSIVYALDTAIELYHAAGAPAAWARHATYARAIRAAAEALGLELFSQPGAHSVTVVAIRVPQGLDAGALQRTLRERDGIVIGGGQQELKGKIVRIGTMGDLSRGDIIGAIGALELGLREHGFDLTPGTGTTAALEVFLSADRSPVLAG